MKTRMKCTPGIYLVGFMGCGKTTIGSMLADRLGWEFVDLDSVIEAEQQQPIARIFDMQGEEYFRRIETEALRKQIFRIQSGIPTVVAVGGGAFARPENYALLESNGETVWLNCPLDIARRRVEENSERPLARDPERFQQLYFDRLESYRKADYEVKLESDVPEEAVEAILRLPLF